MPNKKQNMTATKGAAQQRGKVNLMKQKAKAKASKNKSSASKKKGEVNPTKSSKPTASVSKANLILNKPKDVFKTIKTDNNYKYKLEPEIKLETPEMAAPMKGYHPGKMSDTDMGIKERYGKQATSDVLAAQQKGNPIMPNLYKSEYTDSGMDYRDAKNVSIKGDIIDEENLSNTKNKSPYRPYVETMQTSETPMRPNSAALPEGGEPGEKLFLDKAAKMVAKHPSMKRMEEMVSKVATYNMPNAKAAQKKYCK